MSRPNQHHGQRSSINLFGIIRCLRLVGILQPGKNRQSSGWSQIIDWNCPVTSSETSPHARNQGWARAFRVRSSKWASRTSRPGHSMVQPSKCNTYIYSYAFWRVFSLAAAPTHRNSLCTGLDHLVDDLGGKQMDSLPEPLHLVMPAESFFSFSWITRYRGERFPATGLCKKRS